MSSANESCEGQTPILHASEAGDLRAADLDPVRYVVRPYFPRGVVTMLAGHGGVGKTNLALTILAHVAADLPLFGLEVARTRCAFVSLEDGASLVRYRLRKIAEAYRIDPHPVARVLIVDGSGGDPALAEERSALGVRAAVPTPTMARLAELVSGCGFIVIDNASDGFDADENSRRQVRAFLRMLTCLARENDAAVVLLAHIDKLAARNGSNANSYSGSTAWHNSARSRLALVDSDGRIELRHEKLNVGRKADPLFFAWSDDGVLIPAERRPEGAGIGSIEDDAAAVLNAIRAAIAACQHVTTAQEGRLTTLHVLSKVPELPRELRQGRGKDRFWLAIDHLRRSGAIEAEEYMAENRHPRQRWIICAALNASNASNASNHDSARLAHQRIGPAPNALNAHRGVIGGIQRAHSAHPDTCPRCAGAGCRYCRAPERVGA